MTAAPAVACTRAAPAANTTQKPRPSIHVYKPWRKSTGPRTARGKEISRMNALKHGNRSAAAISQRRAVKHYLRVQKEFLKQVRLLLRLQRAGLLKKSDVLKATNELALPLPILSPFTLFSPRTGEECAGLGRQPFAETG